MINAPHTIANSQGFTVPEASIARHPGVLVVPREVRNWATELPMGNPPHAARLLVQQLRLLVRDPDPGNKFSALLDIYAQPVERLLEIAEGRLQGSSDNAVPLDQLEHTLLELLSELAYGHLRIANTLITAGKRVPATLLYRALDLLDTAHNIERLHYCKSRDQNWRLMLAIYLHAEQHDMLGETVDASVRREHTPPTIRGLFCRTLIINLCDPHQHPPSKILQWHHWTGRHVDDLYLDVLPQGAFAIPIDLSGKFTALAGARRGQPGPAMRYLASEAFLRLLREHEEAPNGLYDALSALIKGRKLPEQRQSPRQTRDRPFRLYQGLNQVHHRLSELTGDSSPSDRSPRPIDCRQHNQSKGGAAFQLNGPSNPPLGIGDLVLAEADNPKPGGAPVGFIGRVQRVLSDDQAQLEIGVEKLTGRLIPVTLSGSAAERTRGNVEAMLLEGTEHQGYTLLAAPQLHRDGDVVSAESGNGRYQLRLRELRQATARIAYIDVDRLD